MSLLDTLLPLRQTRGERQTEGLSEADLAPFLSAEHPAHASLQQACEQAAIRFDVLRAQDSTWVHEDELTQIHQCQQGFLNFYSAETVNPYVALAAAGPWIITSKGAVVHDSGGYGMLGMGHAPDAALDAMNQPHVMANIMTAQPVQRQFMQQLKQAIGHDRADGCPFDQFLCLNSGSESMTLGTRIADANAKFQTDPGAKHERKTIRRVALEGSFHGRTQRPAQFSDNSRKNYERHLASFRDQASLLTIPPNDIKALEHLFDMAKREAIFVEAILLEPVMGEGNPGLAISRAFYDRARELTLEHDSMLIVDSIQAGLRAHGVLSIVDYPGFEDAQAPDMETYSKAVNAGQYPLSILALTDRAARLYRTGLYGNTMTTNPRALDVACAVLAQITPELKHNVQQQGHYMRDALKALSEQSGGAITQVQGTGLLLSAELDADRFKGYGHNSVEDTLRRRGIGVIHGGKNAIRFTPHFMISREEIDLIMKEMKAVLENGQSML